MKLFQLEVKLITGQSKIENRCHNDVWYEYEDIIESKYILFMCPDDFETVLITNNFHSHLSEAKSSLKRSVTSRMITSFNNDDVIKYASYMAIENHPEVSLVQAEQKNTISFNISKS